jgi:hypothetical protein
MSKNTNFPCQVRFDSRANDTYFQMNELFQDDDGQVEEDSDRKEEDTHEKQEEVVVVAIKVTIASCSQSCMR